MVINNKIRNEIGQKINSITNEEILENLIRKTFENVKRFICWGHKISKWLGRGKRRQEISCNRDKHKSIMQLIWANDYYRMNEGDS